MQPIVLLYRRKTKGRNSIENVFLPLENLPGVERVELPCDLRSISDGFKLLLFAFRLNGRNIHITGDIHYMSFFLFWKRCILTIHDCNHYEDLSGLRKHLMGLIWYVLPIKFARTVTTISPFAQEQLQQHFKVPDKKIRVIPNSFIPVPELSVPSTMDRFTVLTIGSYPHKNLTRLIEAVKGLEGIKISIVGVPDNELLRNMSSAGIEFDCLQHLSREELNNVYNASDLLFFASLKEGFGLPILEAQSCGLPVITSNLASMPYVAGKGAHLVDPYNVMEIRNAIIRISENATYREQLIREGKKNIDRFSEETFIASYKDLYKAIIT